MPLNTELRKRYGPTGLGEIKFLKDGSAKIISSDGETWTFPPDKIWDSVIRTNKRGICYGISEDETTLQSVRPWEGSHYACFAGFTKRKLQDGTEEPKIGTQPGQMRTNKGGGQYWQAEYQKFTVLIKIVAGDFKEYILIYPLQYAFEPGPGSVCKIASRSARVLQKLEGFLDAAGFDRRAEDIPYSSNVLAHLEPLLLARAESHPFAVVVEKGWINAINRMPTGITLS